MNDITELRAAMRQATADRAALVATGAPTDWIDRIIENYASELTARGAEPVEEEHDAPLGWRAWLGPAAILAVGLLWWGFA